MTYFTISHHLALLVNASLLACNLWGVISPSEEINSHRCVILSCVLLVCFGCCLFVGGGGGGL